MTTTLLDTITLSHGKHDNREDGVCAMEAVAYIAGEPHSDHPACASKLITGILINRNDSLPDNASRDLWLKDLLPRVVGTNTGDADERARCYIVLDWACREAVPDLLDTGNAKAKGLSAQLRALAPIVSKETASAAVPLLDSLYDLDLDLDLAPVLGLALALARALRFARTLYFARALALARALDLSRASWQGMVRRLCAVGRPAASGEGA